MFRVHTISRLLLAWSGTLLACPAIAQIVVFELSTTKVVDKAVLVRPDQFSRSTIETIGRHFIHGECAGRTLGKLTIAVDRMQLDRSLRHLGTDLTYEKVTADIRRAGPPSGPVARVLAVGRSALLSIRDGTSLVEYVISGKRDPTRTRLEGSDFRILHFAVARNRTAAKSDNSDAVTVFLYAAPPVSIKSCIEMTRRIRLLIEAASLTIHFRPDTWFLEYEQYPDVFPFEKQTRPPNPAVYRLSPQVSCTVNKDGMRCNGQNFVP